jgi:hypothetical protein
MRIPSEQRFFKRFSLCLAAGWLCWLPGCFSRPEIPPVDGLRPIYLHPDSVHVIRSLPPRPVGRLGKLYYKDSLLYINELNRGIHVLDNRNPAAPVPLRFLSIPGNRDIAIKGDYLYADNFDDLVTIHLADLENIAVTHRITEAYHLATGHFPEGYDGYFECVDPARGVAIDWEPAQLEDPRCRR